MFSRWGAFVYRFRRPVAIIAIVIALASTVLASQASSALSAGGWLDANSESAEVAARVGAEVGAGKSSGVALFRLPAPGAGGEAGEFPGGMKQSTAGPATRSEGAGGVGFA